VPDYKHNNAVAWPYPVNYGKENEVKADVLILGGGIAGCHAAINAAKAGPFLTAAWAISTGRAF